MRRLLILAAIALATSSCARNPTQGSVDAKTHKMCLQAKDYMGCVNAHVGRSNSLEVFNNPGTASSRGNSCPYGYAFIGQGYCTEVICKMGGRNNPLLAGKKWKCTPKPGETRANLEPGPKVRAGNNNQCPSGDPQIGWSSTCETPYEEPPKADRIEGRRNYRSGY